MKSILKTISNSLKKVFLSKRKLTSWCLAIVFVISGALILGSVLEQTEILDQGFSLVDTTYANGATTTPTTPPAEKPKEGIVGDILGDIGQGLGNTIAVIATLLIKIVSAVVFVALYWMGSLMDNTFILEGEMGLRLQTVWVIVRNFVNIFFALALVVVAFLSVVGYGDESGNYAMKKFIPKMALALIAVNFTFLACRLVLDVNNVLTTAVFAIPQSVTTSSEIFSTTPDIKIFKNMRCFDKNESASDAANRVKKLKASKKEYNNVIASLGGVCFAVDPGAKGNLNQVISVSSALFTKKDFTWAMATQFQGLHELNKRTQITSGSFKDLSINAVFSLLLAIVYGTAYIAMFIVLIGRMAVLWITIILSPIAVIGLVMPDFMPQELNITKKFLDNAFIPLKMAIPLSFGYILVSQMSASINTGDPVFADSVIDLSEGGELSRNVGMREIIYGAASVAVIWMGVFMAVTENIVGSGIINSFKGTMENIGSTVAKWPTYARFIPTGGGMVSMQGIKYGFEQVQDQMKRRGRMKDDKALAEVLRPFGVTALAITTAVRNVEQQIGSVIRGNELRSNMGGLANDAGKRDFIELSKRLARDVKERPQQHEVARAFGYRPDPRGYEDFKKAVKRNEFPQLMQRVTKAEPAAGEARVDYSTVSMGTIKDKKKVKFSPEQVENMPEATRGALNIRDKDGKRTFDPDSIDFEGLMKNVKDSSKIEVRQLREMVKQDFFTALAENKGVKSKWKTDDEFLKRLSGIREEGNIDLNKKIYETFEEILKDKDGKVDAKDVQKAALVNKEGKLMKLNEKGEPVVDD